MPEPKFQRGDLVRHRASGEVAVVVGHGRRCTKHVSEEERYAHFGGWRNDCEFEFNGTYNLDLGFREDVVTVEEFLLERSGRHQSFSGKMVCCECGWSIDGDLGLIACASVAHATEYPGHRVWLREHR